MTGIYWLASYPKSGNTWLRLLLQSYLAGGAAVDINDVALGGRLARDRAQFDEQMGVTASDLTGDEILAWRPAVIRAWGRSVTQPVYAKTHEMRLLLPNGEALIPPEVTLGAVYLLRDPRDVALSLARHIGESVDAAIALMGTRDRRMGRSRDRLAPHLLEFWGSWSQNAESWHAPALFPIHRVRYETLRADPEAAFSGILAALSLPLDPEAVRTAVAATALDRLRAQEVAKGFIEWPGARGFFGEGRVQGWRDKLTPAQIAQIEADHGPMMRRLGYLDADH